MLVWTQVFRARLTGGRHARFAVTHETLLVRGLVQVRRLIEFPRNVFWPGHACFARANGQGARRARRLQAIGRELRRLGVVAASRAADVTQRVTGLRVVF